MAKKHKPKLKRKTNRGSLLLLFFLLLAIIAGLWGVKRVNQLRSRAVTCDDRNCESVIWSPNTPFYLLTDCENPKEPDGDDQLCSDAGLVGTCRNRSYCCPGVYQKWTTDMKYCPGKPTLTPYPTYTPYPTLTSAQTTVYPTYTPYPTQTPKIVYRYRYFYITPKPSVAPTSLPNLTPTVAPTATPVPLAIPESCNKTCKLDADCKAGLSCLYVTGYEKACRKKTCLVDQTCLCGQTTVATGPGSQTGTGGDSLTSGYQIPVSVAQFTDSNGRASSQFTLSGRTDAGAKVVVSISPDGVGGEVTADNSGRFSYRLPKKLTAGQKQLLVLASKTDGGTGEVRQSFTVVAAKGFSVFGILLIIMIVTALGFGAYVYFKQM